jgi:hypothetical protein
MQLPIISFVDPNPSPVLVGGPPSISKGTYVFVMACAIASVVRYGCNVDHVQIEAH